MATIRLALIPAKALSVGRHKVRIAIHHKEETKYIVTRFKIDNLNQLKNGQVVKRPDAALTNTKLRTLLNEYQEKLDTIKSISMYDCKQLRDILVNGCGKEQTAATFQAVSQAYTDSLREDGRINYASLIDFNSRYFTEFTKGYSCFF